MTSDAERAYYLRNRDEINRKKREHYAANRERIREKQKQYVAENAEKVRARRAAHYQRTREEQLARNKARYAANKDALLEQMREYRSRPGYHERRAEWLRQWHLDHPDARSEYDSARRARLLGAEVEMVTRAVIWERDGGDCRVCGEPADPDSWHLDHIVPLCKGGGHLANNLAVTHPRCNLIKNGSDPREPGSPYAHMLRED